MTSGNKTLIHIEDREEDILLVKRVLEKQFANVDVVSIADSEKVMHEIKNGSFLKRRPFMLLIDINMPKISGIELLEELESRKEYNRVPRIILSSSTHPTDLENAYRFHANSYVEKPKSFSNLKETLVTTVNYWLNLNLS